MKGFHYHANAFFTELKQAPVRRGQFGQSLTIWHPFLRRFTLSGEIWHFTQPLLQERFRRKSLGYQLFGSENASP